MDTTKYYSELVHHDEEYYRKDDDVAKILDLTKCKSECSYDVSEIVNLNSCYNEMTVFDDLPEFTSESSDDDEQYDPKYGETAERVYLSNFSSSDCDKEYYPKYCNIAESEELSNFTSSDDDDEFDQKYGGTDESNDSFNFTSFDEGYNRIFGDIFEKLHLSSSASSDDDDEQTDESFSQTYTLQELCLLTILENFDRFCVAFKTPDSKVPKRNSEFLEKMFSERIFEELKRKKKLKSEYLDYLINPHFKRLNVMGISFDIIPHLIERLKQHGVNILTFEASYENENSDNNFLTPLVSTLTNVETIHYCSDMSDFSVISIFNAIGTYCTSLKSLTIELYQVFDLEWYNYCIAFILQYCPCLETLKYEDTIGALYTLHKYEYCRNTDFKVDTQYALKVLFSETEHRKYPLSDALEICEATCPYVSTIVVVNLETDEELEMISRFTNLEIVAFATKSGMQISSTALTEFLNLRGSKLTTLSVTCVIGLSAETLIKSCPKLQTLTLYYVEYLLLSDGCEVSNSFSLPDLLTLELPLSNCTMPNNAASCRLIISAARNLKTLSLRASCGLTDEFVNSLNLLNIYELDVSLSDIKVNPLIEMFSRGNLQRLNALSCGEITENDFMELQRYESRSGKIDHY